MEDLATAEKTPLQILTRPGLNTSYLASNFKIKEFRTSNRKLWPMPLILIDFQFLWQVRHCHKTLLPPGMLGFNDKIDYWKYDPELSKACSRMPLPERSYGDRRGRRQRR